jgi:hypothetical protein
MVHANAEVEDMRFECKSSVIANLFIGLVGLLRCQKVGTRDDVGDEQLNSRRDIRHARCGFVSNEVVELQVAVADAMCQIFGHKVRTAFKSRRIVFVAVARVTVSVGCVIQVVFIGDSKEEMYPLGRL